MLMISRFANRRHNRYYACAAQVCQVHLHTFRDHKTDFSRAELGNKEIYRINIVSDKKSLKPYQVTEMHMFFQIRDVVPPKPKEEHKSAGTV